MADRFREGAKIVAALVAAVIAAAAAGLATTVLVSWISGCQLLPDVITQRAGGGPDSTTVQTQNDLWPVVAVVAVLVLGFGAVATIFIRSWIKEHSYLRQKPEWERAKSKAGES